jgi:translocation and assembly module TamB
MKPNLLTRRGLKITALTLLGVGLALCLTLLGLWQSLRTERGTQWWLRQVPGLTVTAPRGALLRDFSASHVAFEGTALIEIEKLAWKEPDLPRPSARATWLALRFGWVRAETVRVVLQPDTPPSSPPTDLRWPVGLEVRGLAVEQLFIESASKDSPGQTSTPWRNIRALLQLGTESDSFHRFQIQQALWGSLRFEGQAEIQADAPMNTQARLRVQPQTDEAQHSGPTASIPWRSEAHLTGPLTALKLELSLKDAAGDGPQKSGAPSPQLSATATIHPWERWPLRTLEAQAGGIDLASFDTAAPRTALRAEASMKPPTNTHGAEISIQLHNDDAGLWNEHRLPLRQLILQAELPRSGLSSLDIRKLALEWGTRSQAAGRTTGSGHFSPDDTSFTTNWIGLQPAQIDGRAPPLSLSGPLTLSRQNSEWSLSSSWTGQTLAAPAKSMPPTPVAVDVSGKVKIRADQTQQDAWTLQQLKLRLGEATLAAEGGFFRTRTPAAWHANGRLTFSRFAPQAWWPGSPGSLWQQAQYLLHGQAHFKLQGSDLPPLSGPSGDPTLSWLQWAQGLRGSAQLSLSDSQLSGVPINAQVNLERAPDHRLSLTARVQSGRNLLTVDRHKTRPDELAFQVEADDLGSLAPWHALLSTQLKTPSPWTGSLNAQGSISGTPPDWSSTGKARLTARSGSVIQVDNAELNWNLGNAKEAPLEMDLKLARAAWQGRVVKDLTLHTSGQVQQHHVHLRAEFPLSGPEEGGANETRLLVSLLRGTPQSVQLTVGSQGSLTWLESWQGRVETLLIHSGTEPWFRLTEPVDLLLQSKSATGPKSTTLAVSAGHAELWGTPMEWDALRGSWPGSPAPEIEAHLRIPSLRAAPLLAKLQPQLGWGGDLELSTALRLQSHPEPQAQILVERRQGDLHLLDSGTPQPLGLQALRFMLSFEQGQWTFTQAVTGKDLGTWSGALLVSPPTGSVWPAPDSPLQGVLELKVAQLSAWSTWLPVGWQLSGQVHIGAGFGGSWAAPEIRGTAEGQHIQLLNILEGVDIRDGTFGIQLQGRHATIQHLSARSGKGSLTLQGEASLGEAPEARLKLALDHFQLLGRIDRQLVASGEAALRLSREPLSLRGRWVIDEGLIDFSRGDAPRLSDDVKVIRTPSRPSDGGARKTRGKSLPPEIQLQVNLGQRLRIKGRGLDTRLEGDLDLSAPEGRLLVHGKVNTAEGTYRAYGQNLTIDRGLASFTGDIGNPKLDIEATRPNTDVRVGVTVTGSAQTPRVRLFSEPDLADTEKLSWLVLGRGTEGLSGTDIGLLQTAALGILSGENEGLSTRLIRRLGLDELSVRKSDVGGVNDTLVSMGKQLSRRWYVGYERGLNATEGSWQLIYRIAQRFTLRAQSGTENSLDVIWSWRWQ